MKIIVTGNTGLIGRHLVPLLLRDGHRVIGLTRRPTSAPSVEHRACDVGSEEATALASGADVIVHLAGLADASASLAEPVRYNRINALGTLHILEAARRAGSAVVLASTQRVFQPRPEPIDEQTPRNPVDPYGYSKLVAEEWVRMYRTMYGLRTLVLRFFSVYGPGQEVAPDATSGVVTLFLRRALANRELVVHNHQRRDFTSAADVARGIALAIDKPSAWGNQYNIATGVATSLLELARLTKEITGSRSGIVGPGEGGEGQNYVADTTRARQELGYEPSVPLPEGIELYARWLKERGPSAPEGAPNRTPA